ncbi:hypothetical protein JZU46_06560 [bacterium]|nr:hypothetical protein [bacterium]
MIKKCVIAVIFVIGSFSASTAADIKCVENGKTFIDLQDIKIISADYINRYFKVQIISEEVEIFGLECTISGKDK